MTVSKQLYRLSDQKIIAGVCSGVAEYFEVDPTIVRIVWLLAVFAGFGILAYIICWIIMPEKSSYATADSYQREEKPQDKERNRQLLGIILIVIGAFFVLEHFLNWFDLSVIIPAAIILLGLYILFGARGGKA